MTEAFFEAVLIYLLQDADSIVSQQDLEQPIQLLGVLWLKLAWATKALSVRVVFHKG